MSNNPNTTTDNPFIGFWSDMLSRMGMPAGAAQTTPPPKAFSESAKQMQRVFLDALAKYCDDFMHSEQFLKMMKETMDRSLAFKQQVDQFLGKLQQGMQSPARADVDDLAGVLRNIEERVLTRLDSLEEKVAAVEEKKSRAGGGTRASRVLRPSGRSSKLRKAGRAKKRK